MNFFSKRAGLCSGVYIRTDDLSTFTHHRPFNWLTLPSNGQQWETTSRTKLHSKVCRPRGKTQAVNIPQHSMSISCTVFYCRDRNMQRLMFVHQVQSCSIHLSCPTLNLCRSWRHFGSALASFAPSNSNINTYLDYEVLLCNVIQQDKVSGSSCAFSV